jgi:hypothetical protein
MSETVTLRGAFGRCDNVRKIMSRGVVQIIVEVPAECFSAAVRLLDGKDVWVEEAPAEAKGIGRYWVIDGAPVEAQEPPKSAATEKPYGEAASALYKTGFWFVPDVLAAIGSDAEYRKWIQNQPCIVCGGGDLVEQTGELKCEAAHVKRPSNSGMGHKPEYSCVSLCHEDHAAQHQHGLPALYLEFLARQLGVLSQSLKTNENEAREWFDKERDKLLIEWATTKIAKHFKVESTGFISPLELRKWAREREVEKYLPEIYRSTT